MLKEKALETVGQIWDDLFRYWEQNEPGFTMCKGAGEEEIKSLEASLNIELPNALKESLKRCSSNPNKIEKSSCLLTGGGGKLFDIKEMDESYREMNLYKFFDGEAMSYTKIDTKLEPNTTWSKYFIPIYSWNCNENALIDLRPESRNYEQILYEDAEFATIGVWAQSYEEFLKLIADAIIDHGAFNQDDMEKVRQQIYDTTPNRG